MEVSTAEVITKNGWMPIGEVNGIEVLFITNNNVSFRKAELVEEDVNEWIYDSKPFRIRGRNEFNDSCNMTVTNFGKKKFNYEFVTCTKTVQYKLFMRLVAWLLYEGEIIICQPSDGPQYECVWLRFRSDNDINLLGQLDILYTLRISRDPKFDHVEITHDVWLNELRHLCYDADGKKVPDIVLLNGYSSDELFRRNACAPIELSRRVAGQLQWASLFTVKERWLVVEIYNSKYRLIRDTVHMSSSAHPKRVLYTGKLVGIANACEDRYIIRHCFDGNYLMRLS